MTELDLFTFPESPGYSHRRPTSRDAAKAIAPRAPTLRAAVLARFLHSTGLTADEVASQLRQTVLSIRPRVAELAHSGAIIDSGLRRKNASGRSAIVWKIQSVVLQRQLERASGPALPFEGGVGPHQSKD